MKIITNKKQEEIDNLNIDKLIFAMRTVYEEFASDKHGTVAYRDFRLQANNIYWSDNIVSNGYERPFKP